ncbi:hypothetical protein [Melaminivora alkalimesophila]|uniref:Uncharacterized protein n=1 Tax=Melaminivora alkalimesophila TaxID=1165852 RepID=A0A317R9Z3_9BURK|nr:hypothetical protein [Melaminivora alkalimesophila]PWW45640.1 hypothetical protein DFR36_106130 [Melaminivora alkalimesophila]
MPTEAANRHSEALALRLDRMVAHMEAVAARIAFLGRALDLPLRTPADIQTALECDADCQEQRGTRQMRMREELRGLLVMRYTVVARMAASVQVGAPAARDILLVANDRLLARGFDAGAPGLNLRPLFEGIDA